MDDEEMVEAIFQRDLKIKKLKEDLNEKNKLLQRIKEIAGSSFPDDAIYKILELLED